MAIFIVLFILSLVGCGHKKAINPPPPPTNSNPPHLVYLPQGEGGYFIGDDGYIILYWDFPVKVEISEIFLNRTLIGKTKANTFLVKDKVRIPATFRVIGLKGDKKVAEVLIKVR